MTAPPTPLKPASEQLTVQATRAQWEGARAILAHLASGKPGRIAPSSHIARRARALVKYIDEALAAETLR
jgi:hypothetical protein